MKLTKQVSLFLDLYLFFYDFCKLKHTQVQQGLLLASTVHLLFSTEHTHAGDQQAAVLQRSGTSRGVLGSQAHPQGRGVASEPHRRHRLQERRRRGRRNKDRRRRWESSSGAPAGRGKRLGEGPNRWRRVRGSCWRDESE